MAVSNRKQFQKQSVSVAQCSLLQMHAFCNEFWLFETAIIAKCQHFAIHWGTFKNTHLAIEAITNERFWYSSFSNKNYMLYKLASVCANSNDPFQMNQIHSRWHNNLDFSRDCTEIRGSLIGILSPPVGVSLSCNCCSGLPVSSNSRRLSDWSRDLLRYATLSPLLWARPRNGENEIL